MKVLRCKYPGCLSDNVDSDRYCIKHQQYKRKPFATAKRYNTNLYNTPEWKQLEKQTIDNCPYCIQCNNTEGLQVDHKIPPEGNTTLFYDPSNVQVLCSCCHRIKTAKEIAERKKRRIEEERRRKE